MTTTSSAPPAAPRETYREVLARLHAAQKPPAAIPLYLRLVNRPLGGRIAAAAFVRGATPDGLTAISALCSLAGILVVALAPPGPLTGPVAAVALLVGYAVDSADGQLARLRGGGSAAGEWLDHVVDAVKTCLLHAAVLVHLDRFVLGGPDPAGPRVLLLVPLVLLTASITISFAAMLRDQLLRGLPRDPAPPVAGSWRRSAGLAPIDHGTVCLVLALLGLPIAFLVGYTALALAHVLFAARLLVRSHRRLRVPVVPVPQETT